MNKRETKRMSRKQEAKEKFIQLTVCRLKGHDIIELFPFRWSSKKITKARRKIFKGKLDRHTFMICTRCHSKAYIHHKTYKAVSNAVKSLANTGVTCKEAAESLAKFNKVINRCNNIKRYSK